MTMSSDFKSNNCTVLMWFKYLHHETKKKHVPQTCNHLFIATLPCEM